MRLNDKGFAVSTILYGILSLAIIILLLTFATMKASKDMNDGLVDSIESQLNSCINEEVALETCYFNNGSNCNTSAYNRCIGKTDEDPLLADVASVGDYVDYDAGNWPNTVSVPSTGSNYTFGGYTANESRNGSVSCNSSYNSSEYGWKILSIDYGVVTIMHAGIAECFSYANNESQALYVLTGNNPNNVNVSGLSPKNWNVYVNDKYATSAGIVTKNMLVGGSNLYELITDNSFKGDQLYILGDMFAGHLTYISHNTLYNVPNTNTIYGVKPIVVLKDNVRTSGSISNTGNDANSKTWILTIE